jgi:CheY-like chemotaxis protein
MIYCLDDNKFTLLVYRTLLSKGYTVETFEHATALISACAICKPQLVICDIDMPDANGIEVTRTIKSRWPDVPVLVVTCMDYAEVGTEVAEAGGIFFDKSSPTAKFLEAINECTL